MTELHPWSEIDAHFERAIDLDAAERSRFVEELQSRDARLGEAVAALLAATEAQTPLGDLLDDGAAKVVPDLMGAVLLDEDQEAAWSPGSLVGRYRILELIGAGGMGEVYLAERADGEFQQRVAIKVLSVRSAAALRRFRRERQIQADLRHPHIAQLLDGGVAEDGRPFFVLEYIDGLPINRYAQRYELSLEGRLRLFLQACSAVQHQHSQGVIHRDLKPSNLLVEDDPEQGPRLSVLDFGVARFADRADLTVAGEIVGTPGYMSPEQAQGDVAGIDRRTDVFSLGIVLFELCCRRLPFEGDALAVVGAILSREPPHPRSIVADLPHDLCTIVLHALERDRDRRYGSVRALAEDVGRFLRGEPIVAKPPGLLRRTVLWSRRRPLLLASLLAVALSLLVGGVVTLRAARLGASRAAVAERFGREVEQIASSLRLSYLATAHDVVEERRGFERRLDALEGEVARLPPSLEGPARYALGRGRLALEGADGAEVALQHLERAWELGFQADEVAEALVETHFELYREGRVAADRIDDAARRAAELEALDERHRQPALALAKTVDAEERGRESSVAGERFDPLSSLAEARVHYLNARYEIAARRAAEHAERHPWAYEGLLLAGDAMAALAGTLRREDALEEALERYREAIGYYEHASQVGRSDPVPRERMAESAAVAAEATLVSSGDQPDALIEIGTAACRSVPELDSTRSRCPIIVSRLWTIAARARTGRGEDPFSAIERSIASGRLAVKLSPGSSEAHRRLGDALAYRAEFERNAGRSNHEWVAEAIAALNRAAELAPDEAGIFNSLGLAHWEQALMLDIETPEALPAIEGEIAAFSRAVAAEPRYAQAWSNLGTAYNHRAQLATSLGNDAGPWLGRAIDSFERAIETEPSFAYAYNNLGNVYVNRYIASAQSSAAPVDDLKRAIELFESAAERNPSWAFPRLNMARARFELAFAQLEGGSDPARQIELAIGACNDGLELRPDFAPAIELRAQIRALGARAVLRSGGNVRRALDAARADLERAQSLNSGLGDGVEAQLAEVERELAARSSSPR